MAKNITWCLMRRILGKTNIIKAHRLLSAHIHCYHKHEGCENSLPNTLNIDYGDVKSYKQFLNQSKACPSSAVSALMKTLDVTKENATNIVAEWKIFSILSISTIMDNNDLLRKAGVNKSTLRENMYALADTTSNLKKKVKAIQAIELDINDAIPLFQLPAMNLDNISFITKMDRKSLYEYPNRIIYLSTRLNQDVYNICVPLCNSQYMFKLPIAKLIDVTEFLIEIGMRGEHVVNDFLIYTYSLQTIKKRYDRVKRAGLHLLKPWMVRCPETLIQKLETRMNLRRNILQEPMTVQEYICRELDCNMDQVNALIKRDPTITSIGVEKLSVMLRLLRDFGYTVEEIYRTTRALHTSCETFERRYKRWMQMRGEKPPLFSIVLSEKVFHEQLKKCIGK